MVIPKEKSKRWTIAIMIWAVPAFFALIMVDVGLRSHELQIGYRQIFIILPPAIYATALAVTNTSKLCKIGTINRDKRFASGVVGVGWAFLIYILFYLIDLFATPPQFISVKLSPAHMLLLLLQIFILFYWWLVVVKEHNQAANEDPKSNTN